MVKPCTRASLESGFGLWFIARDAAGKRQGFVTLPVRDSRPGVELIRHSRALADDRGGALIHVACASETRQWRRHLRGRAGEQQSEEE